MAQALPLGEKVPEHGLLNASEIAGSVNRTFHAYVHIPFCRERCGYCDFNTYTASELGNLKQSDYAKSVISEIIFSGEVLRQSNVPKRKLKTIFFGGGTPSLLPAVDLIAILQALDSEFGIDEGAEVTLEANPDTLSYEKLEELWLGGFNRVSIGMQSADPETLRTLERTHNPENVESAINIAKDLGFRTSLDLIFGAPGESIDSWKRTLETAISLNPDHISAYSLIVEPGTKLARQIAKAELVEVDEDLQASKYELTDSLLEQAGFHWYEVSNWARSKSDWSKHNLAYWKGQDWWGYGPGAHSHIGSTRFWNQKHPLTYAKALEEFRTPAAGKEFLTQEMIFLERVLLESRILEGIAISDLKEFFPTASNVVSELIAEGLISGELAISGRLVLTLKGRLLADQVVRRLTP